MMRTEVRDGEKVYIFPQMVIANINGRTEVGEIISFSKKKKGYKAKFEYMPDQPVLFVKGKDVIELKW